MGYYLFSNQIYYKWGVNLRETGHYALDENQIAQQVGLPEEELNTSHIYLHYTELSTSYK